MNYDGIIDLIKLGIEYLLIGLFIILALYVVKIRDDYAESTNNINLVQSATKTELEFQMYHTGYDLNSTDEWLTADEVIACFRKYKDGSVEVFLDKDKDGNELYMNLDTIMEDSKRASGTASKFSVTSLLNEVDDKYYYHPFLVYDNVQVKSLDFRDYHETGTSVTCIAFIRTSTAKISTLDETDVSGKAETSSGL